MAQATPYSYTERKRIRKSFGKRDSVLNVPYLLTMQKDSYKSPSCRRTCPAEAQARGLAGGLPVGVPHRLAQRFVEMKFIEYNIAKPAFDVRECQQRGLTFAAAVRAKLQMIIYDRESHVRTRWSRK
jgi:DNA-directed RNA polymerase subunit beta